MEGIADESGSRTQRILKQGRCSDGRLLEIEVPAQILNLVVTEIHRGPRMESQDIQGFTVFDRLGESSLGVRRIRPLNSFP